MRLAFAFLAVVGTAQAATVYQGTVGSQPVVLRLDGTSDSRYFYLRRGVDISLDVQESGGTMALTERLSSWDQGPDGSYTKVTGQMSLTPSGTGLTGSWSSPDGSKTLPVRLSPVNVAGEQLALPDSPLLKKWRAEDVYTFLKFNHALRPAAAQAGLNWWREPLSGLSGPRLPVGAPGSAVLQDRLLDAANNALSCQGDLGAKADRTGPAWEQSTAVTERTSRLLSLRDEVSYFCGGAHPDAYTDGLILDLRTGRALSAGALWPRLSARELHRRYLAAYPVTADNAECRDVIQSSGADAEQVGAYTAFLTAKGLTVWPTYLPHVALACAEEVNLPYASLAPLAGPLAPRR